MLFDGGFCDAGNAECKYVHREKSSLHFILRTNICTIPL